MCLTYFKYRVFNIVFMNIHFTTATTWWALVTGDQPRVYCAIVLTALPSLFACHNIGSKMTAGMARMFHRLYFRYLCEVANIHVSYFDHHFNFIIVMPYSRLLRMASMHLASNVRKWVNNCKSHMQGKWFYGYSPPPPLNLSRHLYEYIWIFTVANQPYWQPCIDFTRSVSLYVCILAGLSHILSCFRHRIFMQF